MRSILNTLTKLKAKGETALVPYITGGDPELEVTSQLVLALEAAGADILEIGVPFSDPVADGPVNQAAAERALLKGTTLPKLLKSLKATPFSLPIVLFSYYNPILQMGLDSFAKEAKAAGVAGALVLDLPPEEAGDYQAAMQNAGLETVFLATPTTPQERLKYISDSSSGCVYYVARMGVTGAGTEMNATLFKKVSSVREAIDKPLLVGFGIASPEQVSDLSPHVDGVVVGSALVKCIHEAPNTSSAIKTAHNYIKSLKEATKGKR